MIPMNDMHDEPISDVERAREWLKSNNLLGVALHGHGALPGALAAYAASETAALRAERIQYREKLLKCLGTADGDDVSVLKAVRELAEQQRWIPATERLPEVGQFVTVVWGGVVQYDAAMRSVEGCWYWSNQDADPAPINSFTHWRPLPAPPAEGDSHE